MNMQQIKEIAKSNGIKPGKLNKITLVRSIQRTEGNFDCFATAKNGECDQDGCLWREDCFEAAGKKLATPGKSNGNGASAKPRRQSRVAS